jgi:serine/threonine protein phosphatase PrpC
MLVCPKCQFENPNTNKFCQTCGASLTHKTCQECDAQVALNAETCPNCGAFTATVWWAIISKAINSLDSPTGTPEVPLEAPDPVATNAASAEVSPISVSITADSELPKLETSPVTMPVATTTSSSPLISENSPEGDSLPASVPTPIEEASDEAVTQPQSSLLGSNSSESASEDNSKGETSSPTPGVVYLDPQQRYRLLEPQSLQKVAAGVEIRYGTSVRVLDCQPFQQSPLEALMEQQQGETQRFDLPITQTSGMHSNSWKALGIPAIAQPYLALHEAYYPTLPAVHDAWQQNGEAVVLLEDRSGWQQLGDLWGHEELPTLQILYWLDEMAKLWEALEPWHCRQSLLEMTNLRVDEDQVLALQRLYPESTEQQLSLQDLGQMWQMLFNQSQRTQFTSLGAVFRQLCTTEIGTIKELRSQLEAIAQEQQSSASAPALDFDSPDEVPEPRLEGVASEELPRQGNGKLFNDPSPSHESDDLPTVILPMQLLSLDDAGCTDVGHQRERNEDCFGIYTQVKKQENPMGRAVQARGLYILCDGMGGHAAGEVASAMGVETLKRYFQDNWHDHLPTEESVREAVHLANQAIYEVNEKNARSGSGRMGTTLVMILIQGTNAVIAHVGDSRLYRLTRKRGLEQVTIDHEVGQREMKRGVEEAIAYKRPDAYQLTQALGPRNDNFVNPDVQFLELNEDTLFVLCSDGLSDNDLIETHWQTHLAPLLSSRANLDQGILQLIELANEHNGHDNITAVLIRVKVRPNFDQQQLL